MNFEIVSSRFSLAKTHFNANLSRLRLSNLNLDLQTSRLDRMFDEQYLSERLAKCLLAAKIEILDCKDRLN